MREVIKRLSYKPGWQFTEAGGDLLVIMSTPASSGNGNVRVNRRIRNIAQLDDPQLVEAIHANIMWLEAHEIDEWFRIDGTPMRAPHPELAVKQ